MYKDKFKLKIEKELSMQLEKNHPEKQYKNNNTQYATWNNTYPSKKKREEKVAFASHVTAVKIS